MPIEDSKCFTQLDKLRALVGSKVVSVIAVRDLYLILFDNGQGLTAVDGEYGDDTFFLVSPEYIEAFKAGELFL